MPVKTYDMPLISSGLRQEEFIRQMVDSLEYLEAVSSDIFNLISISVAEQKTKLVDINTRINKAEAKVEKLKTSSSRGTLVYSLPKYPAPPVLEDQRPIFSKVEDGICKVRRSKGEIVSKLEPATDHHLKESTAYYILPADVWPSESQLMEGGFKGRPGRGQEENEGLGSLPRYLPSVSSLMLFNTSENPYLKYIIIDPLSGVINKTREQHEEREGPSEAPNSILTREDLTRYAPGSFGYRPAMSAISEIDVPDILPDLPNVAEDIMYDADLGPSIAPSLANVLLPTLPEVETSSILSEPPPSISDLPPPTPLPPEPLEMEPPLPDADELSYASSSSPSSEECTPAASPDPGDDRGALLRQIESFKKKDALQPMQQRFERKAQKQKQRDESAGGGGTGDVMSDLKNKLLLRREGISGHKKEGGAHMEKRESVLEQMSYIIPPPSSSREDTLDEAVLEDSNEDWSS